MRVFAIIVTALIVGVLAGYVLHRPSGRLDQARSACAYRFYVHTVPYANCVVSVLRGDG